MQTSNKKILTIGHIASPYGIKGWVNIVSYTEPAKNIFGYAPLLMARHGKHEQLNFITHRPQGKHFVAQIIGCNDRDQAQTYTGSEIIIYREQLAPVLSTDEYYWTDLEGLTVVNTENQTLGIVKQVFSTGSNDVLIVQGEKRHLIPFLLKQVILEINLEQKTMRVDWDLDF